MDIEINAGRAFVRVTNATDSDAVFRLWERVLHAAPIDEDPGPAIGFSGERGYTRAGPANMLHGEAPGVRS